jgi:hypothetical protein
MTGSNDLRAAAHPKAASLVLVTNNRVTTRTDGLDCRIMTVDSVVVLQGRQDVN